MGKPLGGGDEPETSLDVFAARGGGHQLDMGGLNPLGAQTPGKR